MFLALAGLALSTISDQHIVIHTREPVAPAIAAASFSMTCPSGLHIEIRGFGFARPRGARPQIRVNGRPVAGALAARMAADLSDTRAAYRISPRCNQIGREASLIINLGRRSETGEPVFSVARASITDRGVLSYSGLEPGNADGFWYT